MTSTSTPRYAAVARLVAALSPHDADAVWYETKVRRSQDDAATNPPPPLPSCAPLPAEDAAPNTPLLDAHLKARLLAHLDGASTALDDAGLW